MIKNEFENFEDCDYLLDGSLNANSENGKYDDFSIWYIFDKADNYYITEVAYWNDDTNLLTENPFKSFLRNAFIQGKRYQENWALEQVGEIDEVTEQDFGEWYDSLDLTDLAGQNHLSVSLYVHLDKLFNKKK